MLTSQRHIHHNTRAVGIRDFAGASIILITCAALLLAGCRANRHQTALRQYRAGDLAEAERTMVPLLEKESKNNILYLWDMGMFRFAQGNYRGANEVWMKSDILAGLESGTTETTLELFSSDASKKYLGDPVEHSFASLYVGLGFYMMGDMQNALVAFKKSLEWDFSKDPELQGNMVITNHMMGECYSRLGESDNAVVGFRRALQENPEFVPAYVGIIRELEKQNNMDEAARFRGELAVRVPNTYLERIAEHPQGILTVIMSGPPPEVEEVADAFRKRKKSKDPICSWIVTTGELYSRVPADRLGSFTPDSTLYASLADNSIDHFEDQGGEMGQLTRKAVQSTFSAISNKLFGFGTDTSADLRYWSTISGEVFAMHLPLEPGLHTIRATAYGEDNHLLDAYKQWWHYIPVKENQTTVLVLISHEHFFDPSKNEKAPPPTACCDASGHIPDNVPFVLGGTCFCTPTHRLVEQMHAAGHHPDIDYDDLKKMYDDAGIATSYDHRGCNNLCEHGPHVAFGGKCMVSPMPGTNNYERVLLWTPADTDSVQTSQQTKEGDE